MPLTVENHEPNTTVFAKDGQRITWAAKGHPGDTQRVPNTFAEDVDFINSVEMGILKVTGGPAEVLQALQFETEANQSLRATAAAKSMEDVIDRKADRDIIEQACIGPNVPGRDGDCGRPVLVRSKTANETAPLCEQHQHLSTQFYLVEAGSRGEGATETRAGVVRREWKRVEITAPTRG